MNSATLTALLRAVISNFRTPLISYTAVSLGSLSIVVFGGDHLEDGAVKIAVAIFVGVTAVIHFVLFASGLEELKALEGIQIDDPDLSKYLETGGSDKDEVLGFMFFVGLLMAGVAGSQIIALYETAWFHDFLSWAF